jgi:hypothetical protein
VNCFQIVATLKKNKTLSNVYVNRNFVFYKLKASCGYNVFWTIAKSGTRQNPNTAKFSFRISTLSALFISQELLQFLYCPLSTWRCHVHCQTLYRDVAPKLCIFEIFFVKFAKCFWVIINRPESFFMTHDNELERLFFKKISTIQNDNFFYFYSQNLNKSILSIAGLNSGLVYNSIQKPS